MWSQGRHFCCWEGIGAELERGLTVVGLPQHGFRIENRTIYCDTCGDKTVHLKLMSTEPESASFVRLQLPGQLRRRVLKHYRNVEAITLREMVANQLEVDHRFPQVRWSTDESYDPDMSEEELESKFQLLTRQHNLWKSRYCERCAQTGERGTFIGINFFYEGGQWWDAQYESCEERGCGGCFWYNPELWRQALNKLIGDR
ncbi:MAG: restriction endonuclease [Planctomycetota bacterium]|jgi:hypothetical protein